MWSEKNDLFKVDRKNAVTTKLELKTAQHEALSYGANMSVIFAIFPSCGRLRQRGNWNKKISYLFVSSCTLFWDGFLG